METATLTNSSWIALAIFVLTYVFLITEKINKVYVTMIGASVLIFAGVFASDERTSPEGGFAYIGDNLDLLIFIICMMIVIGIVKDSGFFQSLAISLVKRVKGHPVGLLIVLNLLMLVCTILVPNIPAIMIITPVVVVVIRQLGLPYLPYMMGLITMTNIGGASTPISDPTTFYESRAADLSFGAVVSNSLPIVLVCSVVSTVYIWLAFRKQLAAVRIDKNVIAAMEPREALGDRAILRIGVPVMAATIVFMIAADFVSAHTPIKMSSEVVAMFAAFALMMVFKKDPRQVFMDLVDWEVIFFFMGLFVVVGSLTDTGIVTKLASLLVDWSNGSVGLLSLFLTVGSAVLSVFIDNVPYNITMVGAIKSMAASGIAVYPLWWCLNLGTSIGGAGSPIGSAANVVALGVCERDHMHTRFLKFLAYGFPLVLINAFIAYFMISARY